jgi:hypothetical protein
MASLKKSAVVSSKPSFRLTRAILRCLKKLLSKKLNLEITFKKHMFQLKGFFPQLFRWTLKLFILVAYFTFFVLMGQIRYKSETLENHFHRYINSPAQEKFFAQILSPLHRSLAFFGYPLDTHELERIKSQKTPARPVKIPGISQEKINEIKENLKERQRILNDVE